MAVLDFHELRPLIFFSAAGLLKFKDEFLKYFDVIFIMCVKL